jgi:predicted CXXCH cytochrome family protein
MRIIFAILLLGMPAGAAEEAGKIMRPTDRSAIAGGEFEVVARAPGGRLQLDGNTLTAEQPFPNVWRAMVKAPPGTHKLSLVWEGGSTEITIHTGSNPPAGFEPFRAHPQGVAVDCTGCHELSSKGRFRFRNAACFDCHDDKKLVLVHKHDRTVIAECGLCHNAHGSTVKAHLIYPKEKACKLCHN